MRFEGCTGDSPAPILFAVAGTSALTSVKTRRGISSHITRRPRARAIEPETRKPRHDEALDRGIEGLDADLGIEHTERRVAFIMRVSGSASKARRRAPSPAGRATMHLLHSAHGLAA